MWPKSGKYNLITQELDAKPDLPKGCVDDVCAFVFMHWNACEAHI